VLKCSVIGAELVEVSLVTLAPVVRSWPKQVLRPALGALSYSHTSTLTCFFVSPRGQMRSTSTLLPSEASSGS